MIQKAVALEIAKVVCSENDWPWLEPVQIHGGLRNWTIVTNSTRIGMNARIVIRRRTGEVISKVCSPR